MSIYTPLLSDYQDEDGKVEAMRALVEAQDPSAKEVSDETIGRFLRDRNLDVKKGSLMLLKYLKWRRDFVPNGCFSRYDVIYRRVPSDVLYLQGYDKIGHPILVALLGNHRPVPNMDDLQRYIVYAIDKTCSRIPSGQEKFALILDMKGYGSLDCTDDFRVVMRLLQDYYPERLGKVFFVHLPWFMLAFFNTIFLCLGKTTKTKIEFLGSKRIKARMIKSLIKDIDESQLPVRYGGKLHLVSIEHN
ncbi:phosphatidylinositol transfer protein 3-like isoform X1 [Salvia divinorum]|uniref:Phosphatidylinositol transfer protein 3-like isoform X1 n=1 Tax=Salvia divinorum TaxID=28513 RepID=A0ABD1H278_SALDI